MVNVITLSAVDPGLEHRLGQNKDYEISIYCFSAMNASLRSKIKYLVDSD